MSNIGILREIADDELQLMLDWRNEPGVRANMYTQHMISLEEHLAWWGRVSARDDVRYFMYEFQGVPSGIVGITQIDRANSNCCWAFYAAPEAKRGTGVKMECLALDYVFRDLRLHKLYCEVLAFNSAVIKLHQKFGFQVEGILRQQFMQGNEFIDIYRLGLLASEWDQGRDQMISKATLYSGSSHD